MSQSARTNERGQVRVSDLPVGTTFESAGGRRYKVSGPMERDSGKVKIVEWRTGQIDEISGEAYVTVVSRNAM